MSQEFFDPEIFADFIIEAKEHLETIEPNLLELEKAPDNLSLLNEIFRPMHSLKGASGFLGLNKINMLAHRAENVLDELRKGSMSITSEIMDIILSATDALRQMIDNLETSQAEGDVDIEPLVQVLDSLMEGGAPAAPAAAPAAEAAHEESVEASPEAPVEAEPAEDAPAAGLEPEPVASAAPVEAGSPSRESVDGESWIESREPRAPYSLTAFGEGHLKDFIDEAQENTSSLTEGLLELEKHPEGQDDLVNDLFRYFHNLKGNSGIIGFQELNGLTHEAETLLNNIRKGNLAVSSSLVDLLLFVVDVLEALINRIDSASGSVAAFDISELLEKLQNAVSTGVAELPGSVAKVEADVPPAGASEEAPAETEAKDGTSEDDLQIFEDTIVQQMGTIESALTGMRMDGTDMQWADAMFRSLSTIQNSSGFIGLEEIKVYAQRTAGIVDQGRSTGMDFSLLADLLEQECAIIRDMIKDAVATMKENMGGSTGDIEEAHASDDETPEVSPAVASEAPVSAPDSEEVKKPEEEPAPKGEKDGQAGSDKTEAPEPAPKAEVPAEKPAAPAPKAETPAAAASAPAAKPAAAPAAKPAAGKEEGGKMSSTIRVDHEKLDHLMNVIGELIITRGRYSMLARQAEEQTVDIATIAQDLSETTYAMARISDELQDTIMKVRMMPVASVFSRFPRLVRDLSRKSGKEVELIMEGEETELDKSVVEVIGDPLVHLIRNSMDHGIESDEELRRQRGKSPQGKIWLRAFYRGNSVAIEIEDDGNGIDPEKMRQIGIKKGVVTPEEAKMLDDREAIELIFAPGFSSAEVITDISGRGVGMDVVRTNIKNLKGSISITSEVGKGTKFTLLLPLTLAIIDALMVEVDGQLYAIPLDAVSETTKIEASRLTDVKGRKAVTLRGEVLGICSLAELLGLQDKSVDQEMLSVVLIHDQERRLGLVVDRLLERQEIVIKPLGAYLGDITGISGATIMGDGSVILILDPHEIYTLATSRAVPA